MVLIAALQMELKWYLWKVNKTAPMHLEASLQSWQLLAHRDVQGLQFHEKDEFGNPSVPGSCSVKSYFAMQHPYS